MKIDDTYQIMNFIKNSAESQAYGKAQDNGSPSPSAEETEKIGTQVDFSNASVEFSKAAKMMERPQTERTDKINEIKSKMEEGSYQVDADLIAEKMIREMLTDRV